VKPRLAEKVVGFLSFSDDSDQSASLTTIRPRQWQSVLRWLDDSGLAFYFLQKVKDKNSNESIPSWVLSQLKENFAANQRRIEDMSHRFSDLNQKFDEAGIRYVVLKGFSLVPQFCPHATLRHQSDLDYLTDHHSLPAAQRILVDAGYISKESRSSQESIFILPDRSVPVRGPAQYSADAPHAVELHIDVWDKDLCGLPALPPLFSVEKASLRAWNGYSFPGLADEDVFLLQVVHASHHIFTHWVRTSCLYEIAYFLNRRAADAMLWSGVEARVGDNQMLREFVVLVSEMAAKLFAAPLPVLVTDWGKSIGAEVRVWIENYARYWAFCELPVYEFRVFPRSKLILFLHQQYNERQSVETSSAQRSPRPRSRLSRMACSLRRDPSLALSSDWWKSQRLVRRSIFHLLAGMRYACEIPRWKWLVRSSARAATRELRLDRSFDARKSQTTS
jgi:hypothetical protein